MADPSAQLSPSAHILIVDDDREIRDLLSRFLSRHGYRISVAGDGRAMRRVVADAAVDLVILDVMLPGEDGLSLCRGLRATSAVPIVMLTAIGEDVDRIVGLELGADDYVAKPFNPRELLARIRAVLRRAGTPSGGLSGARRGETAALRFAGWRLDLDTRALNAPDGTLVPLSGGEFGLLAALALHPQRVLSRDQLLDLARGRGTNAFDRSIDVQISRLRRKIEHDPHEPGLIKTVRGGGYMFAPEVERS